MWMPWWPLAALGEAIAHLATVVAWIAVAAGLKAAIINAAKHDWVVHVDADEWLQSPTPGQGLLEGLSVADRSGANCVNFNEFVFIPLERENFYSPDYTKLMKNYYFFQPQYPRLMRAWKRMGGVSNIVGAGHRITGEDIKIHQVDFNLRHYIVLSEEHAQRKYVGRNFSKEDLECGWHRNRRGIKQEQLRLRRSEWLRYVHDPDSSALETVSPTNKHFWEW